MQKREFKFRYVLERNRELKFFDISLIDCEIESSTFERLRQLTVFEGWLIFDRVQYTCLKYKNNEEIYESDIVSDCFKHPDKEIDWHYLGPSGKGVVVWSDDHAGFQIKTNRWNKEKISKALPEHTYHQIVGEWVEKIGNIYKNPELLMEAK